MLHGTPHREEQVRDPLQSLERRDENFRWTRKRDPSELHLRKPATLREPAEHERRHPSRSEPAGEAFDTRRPREVREHFVGDQRDAVSHEARLEGVAILRRETTPGRVMRLDHHERSSTRTRLIERLVERAEVEMPRAVPSQAI